MTDALKIDELKVFLKSNQPVNTKELLHFYQQFVPTLKINTLRWRIYELKKLDIIYSPQRGFYALQEKKKFIPSATELIETISKSVQDRFPYAKFSIFSTQWLTNFSNHMYQSKNIILEVEIDVIDAVFHFLNEEFPNVFLLPDQKMYDYYISPQQENIIITRLYVDAPLSQIEGSYYIPRLEKLLVDLVINTPVILPISQSEIKTIITNVLEVYNINYSTLSRYAKKRGIEKRLVEFNLSKGEEKNDIWK